MMAQVPVENAPSVLPSGSPQPYQSVQASPDDFGAQAGQVLSRAGAVTEQGADMLARHAEQAQALENEAAVDKASAAYQTQVTNAQIGYLQTRGSDAYGKAYDDFTNGLKDARASLQNTLPSPLARKLFDSDTRRTMDWAMSNAAQHASKQRYGDAVASKTVAMDAAASDAISFPGDDVRASSAVSTMQAKVRELAVLHGWHDDTPEGAAQVNSFLQSQVSSMMKGRALAANNAGDPELAKRILDQGQGFINGFGLDADGNPNRLAPITGEDKSAVLAHIQRPLDQAIADKAAMRILQTQPQAATPTADPGTDNNPGNLRAGPDTFQTFTSPADGVVATVNTLRGYPVKYGADTLEKVAAKWAPKGDGENNPDQWAANVGQFAGIDPHAPLDLNDPEVLNKVVPAIARQEKGADKAGLFGPAVVQEGIDRALGGEHVPGGASVPVADQHLAGMLSALDQDDGLTPTQKDLAKIGLVKQYRTAQATLQAALEPRIQAEVSAIRDRGFGIGVSPEEIQRADPANAPKIMANLQTEKDFYTARQAVLLNSPQEDAALVQALVPKDGEGFPDQVKRRDILVQAIQAKQSELAKDPGGYVLRSSPDLQNLAEAGLKDQNAFNQYLALNDKLQSQLGVAPSDRAVLSGGQAKTFVKNLGTDPIQASQTMESLAGHYGDHWPVVMNDLKKAGLPPPFALLASVDDPAGRVQFADALQAGATSLKQSAGTDAVKDVDDAMPGALAPFAKSLRFNAGAADTIQTVDQGAKVLAYKYVTLGMAPAQAAQEAARVVVNGKYDFLDHPANSGPGFSVRVPKGQLPQIEGYANALLGRTTADDLAPVEPGRLGAALGMTDARPEVRAQLQHEAFLSARRGTWVTTPDVSGLMLMDNRGLPVLTNDGKPFGFKFADALAAKAVPQTDGQNGEPAPWGGF